MRQRCFGLGGAAGDEAGEEDEVGEGEEGEGDPEVEEEMVVEGGAVGAGVGGERTRMGRAGARRSELAGRACRRAARVKVARSVGELLRAIRIVSNAV